MGCLTKHGQELGVGDPSKLARREWPCRLAAAPAAFIHAMDAVPNAWVLQHVTQVARRGRVWFTGEKVSMKIFWYFDHQLRILNKV